MSNPSISDVDSELVRIAREFMDIIKALRAEELTDADRAALQSLLKELSVCLRTR